MHFEYSLKTEIPIDIVYQTLRDDLYNLAQYMPDVNKIELLERKETEDKVYTLNKWYGKNILPFAIDQFIKLGSIIAWLDRGEWSKNEYLCNWSYEPYIFKSHINVQGKDIYSTDGKYTTITFTGDIYINFEQYPFVIVVPTIMRKKLVDEFFNIFLSLIKSNFIALIKGLEEYVKKNKIINNT
jgi:hypothetical protein